jgi:hypothetical protein
VTFFSTYIGQQEVFSEQRTPSIDPFLMIYNLRGSAKNPPTCSLSFSLSLSLSLSKNKFYRSVQPHTKLRKHGGNHKWKPFFWQAGGRGAVSLKFFNNETQSEFFAYVFLQLLHWMVNSVQGHVRNQGKESQPR